jgi:Skp family chaperone for outer membrane proteins
MRLIKLAAAAAAVALVASPTAFAQARGGTVVVNFAQLVEQSAMGRDMSTKLSGIATQLQQEGQALQPEGQAIQRDVAAFQTAARGKTPAQIQADPALGPQSQALQNRVTQFQAREQALQGDFDCTRAMAGRDFQTAVTPALRSAASARGATVVIDVSNALYYDPASDITTTVQAALDQSSRTATVALHRVAECQPAQGSPAGPTAPSRH